MAGREKSAPPLVFCFFDRQRNKKQRLTQAPPPAPVLDEGAKRHGYHGQLGIPGEQALRETGFDFCGQVDSNELAVASGGFKIVGP